METQASTVPSEQSTTQPASQGLKGVFSRLTDAAWSLSRRLADFVQVRETQHAARMSGVWVLQLTIIYLI
jgi:hypothetical protein